MQFIEDLKKIKTVPVMIADERGGIVYVNPSFEDFFGWSLEEIKNRPISIIIPQRLHDAHNLGFSRFLLTNKPTLLNKPINLIALKKNGEEFAAIHTIIAEQVDGRWLFGATIQPKEGAE